MKRLLAAAVAGWMIVVLMTTALASGGSCFSFSQRTVRVGISPFPHFSEVVEDGSYRGIIIDYLNEIQKYTGWKIEYVLNDPETSVRMLDSGAVDLMGGMNKTPQTIEYYHLAELNSGYAYSTITVKKSHTEYVSNDYDTFSGIRVAVYRKAVSRIEAFEQFCSANGLNLIPVYFDDPLEWESAFATGAVEAQLTSSAKLRDDEKIIAGFKKDPYYFGVAKGNSAILRELNYALEQINQINPNFDSALYKKYFAESGYGEFTLTSEEKAFVAEHPVLRVAAAPDWEPISYVDDNGRFCGISADLMKIISEKTGFTLEYVRTESFRQSLALLETDQVDLLIGAVHDGLGQDGADLVFSLPYLPIQAVMLYRSGHHPQAMAAPRIANVYGLEYEVFANSQGQNYDRTADAIRAVRNSSADFTVISNLVAEHDMIHNGKSGLAIVPLANVEAKLSVALHYPANPMLITLLDRAIYSIHETQQQSVIFQNTSLQNSVTLKSFIYANPIQSVMLVVSVGLLVFLLLFIVMSMRLRLSRRTALISDTYRIIGELSDEYIFAYDFESEILSLPERFAALAGADSQIRRADCWEDGACRLISAFHHSDGKSSFSLEFNCPLADGSCEMFRAGCMVIYDSIGRPVRGIGKLVSIQAELDAKKKLEEKVNTDPLTGLYSKCYCEQWAEHFIQRDGVGRRGALMLIDIDRFKDANDTLGHLGGDAVLQHFSRTLEKIFTDGEVLGRWGGDEFIVFINDVVDRATVEQKAQRLCTGMNERFVYQGAGFDLSISVGIAFTDGVTHFRELFESADNALYQRKRGKKNGYRFAEDVENASVKMI